MAGTRNVNLNRLTASYTSEHAEFAVEFAIDYALAIQSKLGPGEQVGGQGEVE